MSAQPATVVATLDGHTEMGVLQDIVYAKSGDADQDAIAAARGLLEEQGQPKVTLKLTVPLLPDIQPGDRHPITAGAISGYMYVEGYSAAEASRTILIEFAPKYEELFATGVETRQQASDNGDSQLESC